MKDLTPSRRAMVGVVAMAAAIGLAIFDSVRVSQAWRLLGTAAVWATVWGALSMVATTGFIVWTGKHQAWARSGGGWRAYRWAVGGWAVALVLAFGTTHSRWRSDRLTSNVAVGITSYTATFFILVFFSAGFRTLWPRMSSSLGPSNAAVPDYQALTERTHSFGDPDHQAEVWHVHLGRDEPDYYIAHCDCDWVGTPYDMTEPDSEQSARREANHHCENVADAVVEI